jgi:hypothetical protein
MNIFEYLDKSGKAFWVDEKRERTFFSRPDGSVEVIPFDGSYKLTINRSWYGWFPCRFPFNVVRKASRNLGRPLANRPPHYIIGL